MTRAELAQEIEEKIVAFAASKIHDGEAVSASEILDRIEPHFQSSAWWQAAAYGFVVAVLAKHYDPPQCATCAAEHAEELQRYADARGDGDPTSWSNAVRRLRERRAERKGEP